MTDLQLMLAKLDEIEATVHRIYRFLGAVPPCQQAEWDYDRNTAWEQENEWAYEREMESRLARERARERGE